MQPASVGGRCHNSGSIIATVDFRWFRSGPWYCPHVIHAWNGRLSCAGGTRESSVEFAPGKLRLSQRCDRCSPLVSNWLDGRRDRTPQHRGSLGTLEEKPNFVANATVTGEAKDSGPQPLTLEERDKIKKDLDRWAELKKEDRGRIEDRLKVLPASEDRDQLVKEYGRQVLEIKE